MLRQSRGCPKDSKVRAQLGHLRSILVSPARAAPPPTFHPHTHSSKSNLAVVSLSATWLLNLSHNLFMCTSQSIPLCRGRFCCFSSLAMHVQGVFVSLRRLSVSKGRFCCLDSVAVHVQGVFLPRGYLVVCTGRFCCSFSLAMHVQGLFVERFLVIRLFSVGASDCCSACPGSLGL